MRSCLFYFIRSLTGWTYSLKNINSIVDEVTIAAKIAKCSIKSLFIDLHLGSRLDSNYFLFCATQRHIQFI